MLKIHQVGSMHRDVQCIFNDKQFLHLLVNDDKLMILYCS